MVQSEFRLFISHSATDAALAFELCEYLTQRGLPCWIGPRDMQLGQAFSETIHQRIETSHAMIVLLSRNSNDSVYVHSEIVLAFEQRIPLLQFRIHSLSLNPKLVLYLKPHHYLDATEGDPRDYFEQFYHDCRASHEIFLRDSGGQSSAGGAAFLRDAEGQEIDSSLKTRKFYRKILIAAAAFVVVTGSVLGYMSWKMHVPEQKKAIVHVPVSVPAGDTGHVVPSTGLAKSKDSMFKRVVPPTLSRQIRDLPGASFIEGTSRELSTVEDEIKFFGLEGSLLHFSIHTNYFNETGVMRIRGNNLTIIEAVPRCTGTFSLSGDGMRIEGSFVPSTSERPQILSLQRLRS